MNYELIELACEQLDYRDKLKLAQLLIQVARKEEEESKPEKTDSGRKERNNNRLHHRKIVKAKTHEDKITQEFNISHASISGRN